MQQQRCPQNPKTPFIQLFKLYYNLDYSSFLSEKEIVKINMDLRVGGKFKLIKKVGSGAFGEIY